MNVPLYILAVNSCVCTGQLFWIKKLLLNYYPRIAEVYIVIYWRKLIDISIRSILIIINISYFGASCYCEHSHKAFGLYTMCWSRYLDMDRKKKFYIKGEVRICKMEP